MRAQIQPVRDQLAGASAAGGRPIVLATLGAPLDEGAATFAVDAAVESGEDLIVANVTRLEPLGLSMILGYDALEEFTPEVSESLRRPAELARALGVQVERLRVRTPRPVEALMRLVAERKAGLLVFGPDRRRISARRYRRVVGRIRAKATCLVWLPA